MKKTSLAIFISMLSLAGISFAAQSPSTEIRESTDPAKAAEVEQRAADLQARQQTSGGDQSASEETTTRKPGKRAGKKHMAKSGKAKTMEDASGTSSGAKSQSGTSSDTGQSSEPASK